MSLKMYCIVSKEALDAMGGNRGKLAAQAGHAYLHSYWETMEHFPERAKEYKDSNHAIKICLIAETTEQIIKIAKDHEDITGVTIVKDAGFTVFKEPTVTCVGIGPILKEECNEELKSLKPLL